MPDDQAVSAVTTDGEGGIEFSEQGLQGLQELFDGAPVVREKEKETPTEETPEPEKPDEQPAVTPKYKIKVEGKEEELSVDELIARAQMGTDYTKKTQQLAEKERQLAPLEGLQRQLQTDPNFNQHILSYFGQKKETPVEQPPEDPVDRLKWEMRQEILADVKKEIQGSIQPLTHQQVVQQVRTSVMADPQYHEVHGRIVEYVKSLPPAIQKTAYLQLDQDPQAYLDTFQHFKRQITTQPTQETPKEQLPPTPVQKTDHAPLLENAGSLPPTSTDAVKQREKIDKAKAKALRSGSTEALADFIQIGGFLKDFA